MKAYGVPRECGAEWPDKADLKKYGRSTVDLCTRADRGKNEARRRWKKTDRRSAKDQIRMALDGDNDE